MLFVVSVFIIIKFSLLENVVYCRERIVGGEQVTINDFPYQLSLRFNGNHLCGAAIISQTHGITAGHCARGRGAYTVKAGSSNLNTGGVTVFVSSIITHPGNNRKTDDYDIALLEFSTPLNFSSTINSVKLPKENECIQPGTMGNVSGWGTLIPSFPLPTSSLRAVNVPVLFQAVCQRSYFPIRVTPRMFCAGYKFGGKDACQGDSGGPFVIKGTLYGLVSWGFDCARAGYPGVYTNIPVLRKFIRDNTGV